jgi:spore germination cell wall hydrolase CwlJ-like protein
MAWTAYANFIPSVRTLGQAFYFEARNEPLQGKLAIAAVIFNQINDPQYPKTVVSVIMAGHERGIHCDFSYTCDGLGEGLERWGSWFKQQELFALAGIVLGVYNGTGHYYDPTGGALTYQAVAGADTGWFGLFEKCAVIGGHKFYCKKKTTAITANVSP